MLIVCVGFEPSRSSLLRYFKLEEVSTRNFTRSNLRFSTYSYLSDSSNQLKYFNIFVDLAPECISLI